MSQPDKVPDGGKFRALASAAIDGEEGAFGADDLLCVAFNGDGELIVAGPDDVVGVIWTREGKRKPNQPNYKEVIGGNKYTVFRRAEFVEMEQADVPFSAGDRLWADDDGGASTSSDDAIFLGWIDDTGNRLILDLNGMPVGSGS